MQEADMELDEKTFREILPNWYDNHTLDIIRDYCRESQKSINEIGRLVSEDADEAKRLAVEVGVNLCCLVNVLSEEINETIDIIGTDSE